MAKEPDAQAFAILALSLSNEELQRGLDLLIHFALMYATEDEDWDMVLAPLGFSKYDLECVRAAHAWAKRVIGMDEFTRTTKKEPARAPRTKPSLGRKGHRRDDPR